MTKLLRNGNNVVLMSPRRMGKTGLLMHSFSQAEVAEEYNTFLIDIYATSNLQDLVFSMGKAILVAVDAPRPEGVVPVYEDGVVFAPCDVRPLIARVGL